MELTTTDDEGVRGSSVVDRLLMVRCVIGSIHHGGPNALFLIPALHNWYVPYVLSCLWDGAYKRSLAANQKE